MDILIAHPALALLPSAADRWSGSPGPWFLLVPLLFWTLVVVAVVLARRRWRGRTGEAVLREAFARGEVGEADYRERLAVLRATRR
jgi:putative membrane protein